MHSRRRTSHFKLALRKIAQHDRTTLNAVCADVVVAFVSTFAAVISFFKMLFEYYIIFAVVKNVCTSASARGCIEEKVERAFNRAENRPQNLNARVSPLLGLLLLLLLLLSDDYDCV